MLDKAIAITDEIAKRTDEVILSHSASGKDSISLPAICPLRFNRYTSNAVLLHSSFKLVPKIFPITK